MHFNNERGHACVALLDSFKKMADLAKNDGKRFGVNRERCLEIVVGGGMGLRVRGERFLD